MTNMIDDLEYRMAITSGNWSQAARAEKRFNDEHDDKGQFTSGGSGSGAAGPAEGKPTLKQVEPSAYRAQHALRSDTRWEGYRARRELRFNIARLIWAFINRHDEVESLGGQAKSYWKRWCKQDWPRTQHLRFWFA